MEEQSINFHFAFSYHRGRLLIIFIHISDCNQLVFAFHRHLLASLTIIRYTFVLLFHLFVRLAEQKPEIKINKELSHTILGVNLRHLP
jgi:hypothetical protein